MCYRRKNFYKKCKYIEVFINSLLVNLVERSKVFKRVLTYRTKSVLFTWVKRRTFKDTYPNSRIHKVVRVDKKVTTVFYTLRPKIVEYEKNYMTYIILTLNLFTADIWN